MPEERYSISDFAPPARLERLAYTINEFCSIVGVSRPWFYNLPDSAKPRMVKIAGRILIPAESVREWLKMARVVK